MIEVINELKKASELIENAIREYSITGFDKDKLRKSRNEIQTIITRLIK